MLMAHTSIITTIILLLSSLLITATYSQQFSRDVSQHELGLHKQKLSHLHFYFHDAFGGRHPTVVRVATAASTNTSASSFGALMMIDDPLTIGPKSNSKIVGRAQGIYGFADLKIPGLLMVMNYVFTDGKFNGSTLSVLGRNPVLNTVREMPIVGGSGVFRFARGYAQAKTHRNLPTSTIVEYNVYVFHY